MILASFCFSALRLLVYFLRVVSCTLGCPPIAEIKTETMIVSEKIQESQTNLSSLCGGALLVGLVTFINHVDMLFL